MTEYDADELLRRMIADEDSDWDTRLLAGMANVSGRRAELSPAELAVITAASHGLTAGMAADVLGKQVETIKQQLKHSRLKVGAKNTAHAVAIALRTGLIK